MVKIFTSRKAQNLTEVAIVIGIVALVFISMEAYFKRGLQAKIQHMSNKYITGTGMNPSSSLPSNQEAYEIDTHNYTVLDSTTPTQSSSSVKTTTLSKGARVETSQTDTSIGSVAQPATSHSIVNY